MNIKGKTLSIEFKPRGSVESSIGKLIVFDISVGDMELVWKKCGGSFKDCKPHDVAKRLLPFIAHSEKNLDADGTKPKEPTLSDEQVNGLDDVTVNALLQIFIDHHKYLYRKFERKAATNDAGQKIESFDYGDVIHPRMAAESNIDYLQRLLTLDEEKRLDELKQMTAQFDRMIAPAHFSDSLVKQISGTLELGESLKKAFDAALPVDFRKFSRPESSTPPPLVAKPVFPSNDFDAVSANAKKARWAPFNSLAKRLDTLVATTVKSQEFMVQMNQTNTRIAAEIKASSEETSRIGVESLAVANKTLNLTNYNFWLAIFASFLTLVSILIAAASWLTSANPPNPQDNRADDIVQALSSVRDEVVNNRQSSDNAIAILNDIKNSAADHSTKLQMVLDSHMQKLNQQTTDYKTVEALRLQVTQLEAEIDKLKKQRSPQKDEK
jgi:hypothetical protein